MMRRTSGLRRGVVVPLTAALAVLALPSAASAAVERTVFFEETAQAFWQAPHTCADGTTVQGTFLVAPTRDFESPETEDAEPTVRLQYLAVCADGTSFSWGVGALAATITSTSDRKSLSVTGSGTARDNLGVVHQVSVDATWTGVGPLQTSVSTTSNQGFSVNTSTRKQRAAIADALVTFDGGTFVDGPADHPTRPAPFIRVDEEKTTRPG
jgi:hypothetical protein